LRIQIQTDPGYQDFIARPTTYSVLRYEMKVARKSQVLKMYYEVKFGLIQTRKCERASDRKIWPTLFV
jgi:hypothetical protein